MCDLISRQAAIDGLYEMSSDIDHLCTLGDYVSFLESLSTYPEIILCKDCVFGHIYFDVHNDTHTESWVECINLDGLNRDVSCEGYCSAAIRRKADEAN